MRTPLLLFALLGPLPTSAFYPTKFRANLSMTPGISHEQMTEEVLTSVATSFFPSVVESFNGALGAPLSRGMLEARAAIVRSNVWVDWGYHMPYWHFDGDFDLESVDALEDARAALVKHMFDGDVDAARVNLGQALHILQDYYASRNPGEQGGDIERLWRRDLLSQSALSSDKNTRGHGHAGESRYGLLTGKFRSRDHEAAKQGSHPRKQDAEHADRNIMENHSLNSSDSEIHLQAVELAKEGSEIFINYLAEYLTDRQLQHLFGLSLDSAILVDPTVFSSPDWEDAKVKIATMFEATREFGVDMNRAVRYTTINLLSQSPAAIYEDWHSLEATDASRSLDMLRDTVAGYGIGCYGIKLEAVLCALQQFKTGGEVLFVVGQDFVRDSEVEAEIVDFITNNPVAVTILQLETGCPKKKELTLSQSLADLSGGKYITAFDAHETLALPQDGTLEAQAGLSVIQLSSNSDGTAQNNIRFPVDGSMGRLLITVDWAAPAESPVKVLFSDPKAKTFEPVSKNADGQIQRAIWKVDSPVPGEWTFSFEDEPVPSYNLTIKGRSSIQLSRASFVESAGIPGHEGYFDILKDVLPAATKVGMVGEIYGLASADSSAVEWFVVDAHTGDEAKIPMTAGLDPAERPGYADKNTFFGITNLHEGNFYLVVRGVDAQGYKFQRSVPSLMSAKYYPDEIYELGDLDSVVNFPDALEDEDIESEERQIIVARQIVTGTGVATGTAATSPGASPFSPTGPLFPNATALPGTGATTLGTSATVPPLPTGATSILTGTSPFNTSVPSATIPIPGATNATSPTEATETAGATFQPSSPVPTDPGIPGGTETLTTIATILPPGTGISNGTTGVPLTTSSGGNATATAQAGPEEAPSTVSVTVTQPCYGSVVPPPETIASQDAISQPAPSSSARPGCKACEAQSPEAPRPPPKETFTEAQHPNPYSPLPQPKKPQETRVITRTAAVETTVETTKTLSRTSVVPAKTPVCEAPAPEGYGSATPSKPPKPHESPAAPLPSTSAGMVYGGEAFTVSADGTFTSQGTTGHTASSPGAEETSGTDESADETAAGETASADGIKRVRAGVVAVIVVAVGGMVFLIL